MSATPVVLVGGGLGSGKTTVLRALLKAGGGRRIGLVVNEFGDLNIDGVVLAESGADVVELPNGCLCCATAGDLGGAINRLLRAGRPDVIVVELSGVADPYPLLREVALLAPRVALLRVVAVIDLERAPSRAVADPVLLRLLTVAGAAILNKADRAAPAQLARWRELVAASNPACVAPLARFGQVPPSILVGPAAAAPDVSLALAGEGEAARPAHASFQTVTIRLAPRLSRARLETFFASRWDRIERAKGFAALSDGPCFVQVVRGRCTFERLPALPERAVADHLVLISGRLDRAALLSEAAELTRGEPVHRALCTGP